MWYDGSQFPLFWADARIWYMVQTSCGHGQAGDWFHNDVGLLLWHELYPLIRLNTSVTATMHCMYPQHQWVIPVG